MKMITNTLPYLTETFLENLRKLLSAFKWTADGAGGLDDTSPNSSVFASKPLHEQACMFII